MLEPLLQMQIKLTRFINIIVIKRRFLIVTLTMSKRLHLLLLSLLFSKIIIMGSCQITNLISGPELQVKQLNIKNHERNQESNSKHKNCSQSNQKEVMNEKTIETSKENLTRKNDQKIQLSYKDFLTNYKPGDLNSKNNQIQSYRQAVYQQNLDKINIHNEKSSENYTAGVNSHTDLSESEFMISFGNLIISQQLQEQVSSELAELQNYEGKIIFKAPPQIKIGWKCYQGPILLEGKCMSGYAISALDSIQTNSRIQGRNVRYLSIQQVISCGFDNKDIKGCQGGFYQGVYDYVKGKGVGQNSVYYYDDRAKLDGVLSACNGLIISSPGYTKTRVFIKESKRIKAGDCQEVVKQLKFRVMTVAIASTGFQFYTSGTFSTTNTKVDHGVVLVGYDPQRGYLIKNTWGTTWGIQGYGYVSQSTGVCNYAIYPILANDTASENSPPKECA